MWLLVSAKFSEAGTHPGLYLQTSWLTLNLWEKWCCWVQEKINLHCFCLVNGLRDLAVESTWTGRDCDWTTNAVISKQNLPAEPQSHFLPLLTFFLCLCYLCTAQKVHKVLAAKLQNDMKNWQNIGNIQLWEAGHCFWLSIILKILY